MLVKNKVIAVTGGGNGIGREIALLLLEKGAKVAAIDINKDYLDQTAELAGEKNGNLSLHVIDITDREAVEALPEAIIAKHGAVDGVINNAGVIQPFVKVADLDYKKIEFVMNVNFYGTIIHGQVVFAVFVEAAGSSHCQRFQHGRLFAGAGTIGIRRVKSRG
jgi:NAD(P)-dependent dehydrogenase (short-subunit alcohol dehydrogenase family)